MADATASVAIKLENGVSGPAQDAASALEQLKSGIQSDTAELRAMQNAMRTLQSAANADKDAIKNLQEQIVAKKAAVNSATADFVKLGGSFAKAAAGADDLAEPIAQSGDAIKGLMDTAKGGLGPMNGLFERLQMLKTGGPVAAIIALEVAFLALGAAVLGVVYKMAEYALACTDAANKQKNLLTGLTGSTQAASELQSMISDVAGQVPIASSEVAKFAEDLYKSGKRGDELKKALVSASMAAAGLGKDTKIGSELARKAMLPLDVQVMKARENFAKIFAGAKVESFEKALQMVLSLLDENSSAAKALKFVVETILNPLFDAVATLGPAIKAFFQGMVIAALVVVIAVLKVRKAFKDAFGGDIAIDLDLVKTGLYAGMAAVVVLTAAVAALAVVMAAFVAGALVGLMMLLAPVVLLMIGVAAACFVAMLPLIILGVAVYGLYKAFVAARDAIAGMEWGSVGRNLMDGLLNGITSGAGAVLDSIRNLAANMTSTIKNALKIASPSKVFEEVGEFTSEGMAIGVERKSGSVTAAVGSMVSIPSSAPSGASASASGRQIIVNINGVKGAEQLNSTSFFDKLADAIETAALMSGAPLEVPA